MDEAGAAVSEAKDWGYVNVRSAKKYCKRF